jgi:hypothetical protein
MIASLLAFLTLTLSAGQPMPAEYCAPQPGGPPKAMGLMTGYGLVLGEKRRAGDITQDEMMTAITRIQEVIRLIAQVKPEEACALVQQIEVDYHLDRPDLGDLPKKP